jgi:hypothetical protein
VGEWRYFGFSHYLRVLKEGSNRLDFKYVKGAKLGGYMLDSVLLEWK